MFVREIGLCCTGSFGFLASLGSSIIVACPSCIGMSFFSHMWVIRACVISTVVFPPACSTSAQMLSGPGALFFARFRIVNLTSFSVGGGVEFIRLYSRSGGLYSPSRKVATKKVARVAS